MFQMLTIYHSIEKKDNEMNEAYLSNCFLWQCFSASFKLEMLYLEQDIASGS